MLAAQLSNTQSEKTEVKKIVLDNESRINFLKEALYLESPSQNFNRFLLKAQKLCLRHFPEELFEDLQNFRDQPRSPAYLMIGGLPVDPQLPPTPLDGQWPGNRQSFAAEACQLGISSFLGRVFSYKNEKRGDKIHSIAPSPGKEEVASNAGSSSDFEFHVEAAYFNFRPHYLSLFCLRGDRLNQAATTLAEARTAIPWLTENEIQLLRQKLFAIRPPRSFENADQLGAKTHAVFSGDPANPELLLNFNEMRALNSEAQAALNRLREVMNSPLVKKRIVSQPGDMLLVDNRRAVHGRSPFRAFFDGQDRWLLRNYIHRDPWQAQWNHQEGVLVA